MRPRGRISHAPRSRCSGTPAESSRLRRAAVFVPVLSPRRKLLPLRAARKSPKFCRNLGVLRIFAQSSRSITRPNFPEFGVASGDPALRSPDVTPANFFTIWRPSGQIFGKFGDLSEAKFPENFMPGAWCLHPVDLHPAQVASTLATLRDARGSMRMGLRSQVC